MVIGTRSQMAKSRQEREEDPTGLGLEMGGGIPMSGPMNSGENGDRELIDLGGSDEVASRSNDDSEEAQSQGGRTEQGPEGMADNSRGSPLSKSSESRRTVSQQNPVQSPDNTVPQVVQNSNIPVVSGSNVHPSGAQSLPCFTATANPVGSQPSIPFSMPTTLPNGSVNNMGYPMPCAPMMQYSPYGMYGQFPMFSTQMPAAMNPLMTGVPVGGFNNGNHLSQNVPISNWTYPMDSQSSQAMNNVQNVGASLKVTCTTANQIPTSEESSQNEAALGASSISSSSDRLVEVEVINKDEENDAKVVQQGGARKSYRRHKEPEVFKGDVSVEYYLAKFEEIADWNGWSDMDRAQQLRFSLSEKMEKSLKAIPTRRKYDYSAVKNARRQFVNADPDRKSVV
jgi:hypothetical protein